MKKKRSVCLLLATVIGAAYLVYIISYFMKDADTTVGGITTMLVMPHIVVSAFGVLFGIVACLTRGAGFALASAILYCVSAALFIMYAVFLAPSIVLGFVGYNRQKKLNEN